LTNDESNSNDQSSKERTGRRSTWEVHRSLRFLIIKPSALGDVATTLPLLCDLKRAYPEAQIDWLIHPAYAAVIEGHDALHEAILFDRRTLAAWWYKPSAFRLFWKLLRTLRSNRYDLVVDAQGLFRSGFFTRITGARIRIGFAHAREFAARAYTHKVRLPDDGKTMLAVDRMRALGGPLDLRATGHAEFHLPVSSAALREAESRIPNSFVAVIPGARWDTKRWPLDRYTEIVRRLLKSDHAVALLGSPDEKPLCDQIQSSLKCSTTPSASLCNLAGQTDLPTLIALLSRARLVIGNDSGPLHIAAALGVPLVALYGPTDPRFVGPHGQLAQVLRHDVPCHPCRLKECDHHSCMNGLPVEDVWEKVRASLAGQAKVAARAGG
jgi:heptosyltransferase I